MAKDKKLVKNITSRDEDFAQWYTDVVREAQLCDYSSVKGCLNYLPNGFAIWELIKADLDRRFKETGVENVYLPCLIPEALLEKEADHIEGFAPEVAWVTHGGMERLQERFCVRLHLRHCSVTYGQEQYSLTEIYQKYGTSGAPYFAGRRQRDRSFVPENSYGRKATRFMQHMKRLNKEQSRCGRFTKTSTKRQWLYHL